MENIELSISDDDVLTLRVDLNKEVGLTGAMRSKRIATSGGNIVLWKDGKPLPNSLRFNLNVFRSLTDEEQEDLQRELRRKTGGYR